jgi:drug/metabolite transporter (DMT)-like permease
MAPARTTADWGIALALSLVWGTAFLLTRIALGSLPPATLVALRLVVAAAILSTGLRITGRRFPSSPRVWLHFLLMGLMGNGLPFFLVTWGQQRIASGLAGILMAVIPLATLVLAHFLVDGDRMTPAKALGFVLGFAGVVVLIGPDAVRELGGSRTDVASQLAVLAGAFCWAANAILARRLPPMDATVAAAGTLVTGSAIMVPVALMWETPWRAGVTPGALAAALWLGVVCTALADTLYFRLIATAGPTFFALINYLIPVVAAVAGVVVLGEVLPPSALAALALILAGLAFGQRPGTAAPERPALAPDRGARR